MHPWETRGWHRIFIQSNGIQKEFRSGYVAFFRGPSVLPDISPTRGDWQLRRWRSSCVGDWRKPP
ncbi:MAG: hypothetical protein EOR92_10140 [Mesorhizobium sp.]|nr:MAG: hypothetical protein EOQ56_10910 [Mesorhizobium sp.]RWQ20873.1 MAG: hypothetical protein EOR92_10140 [Mesorhizobium sp.]